MIQKKWGGVNGCSKYQINSLFSFGKAVQIFTIFEKKFR